jgi:hypothetical protein
MEHGRDPHGSFVRSPTIHTFYSSGGGLPNVNRNTPLSVLAHRSLCDSARTVMAPQQPHGGCT